MRRPIREIHDLTSEVAGHYRGKYGDRARVVLEKAARICAENEDWRGRNRLLRLRDELLFDDMHNFTE
ncbi:hypothetical protein [uncultured Sneathiella sp.]|uniref:hypothetical protein n=1 Tax=uncultured Sneathiella sp. TaxID=879315 RepID=UPI0025992917|nr:hypothetical protein [uncultured Sneathiella sp.]